MESIQVDGLNDERTHKKGRHRKKQLYSSILSQMEFYFSDSNLSKDRFLSQLIQENPYVNLETFLKFNKLRRLTTNIEDIQKALRKSNIIQLSDDNNSVCRKEPVKEKLNVDECTIYVEGIKSDSTHDWLTQVFSEFGTVVYVSIPKYSHNKLNKGFAFIEFNTEIEAENALNYFDSIDLKIPAQTDPEQLCSISTFEGNQTINVSNKRKFEENEEDDNKFKKIRLTNDNDEDSEKKRKKQKKKKNFFKELGLRVLSKKDWKKMRNRYLDLQKKKMKEFKQHLHKAKFSQQKFKKPDDVKEETGLVLLPGSIVKVKLNEPCQDSKILKAEIKAAFPNIKYVDIPSQVGSEEIYVRFNTDNGAKEFCKHDSFGEKSVLTGEDESLYWKKIESDRKIKLNRESKKQRGRDKLLKKAKESVKHIKFDE